MERKKLTGDGTWDFVAYIDGEDIVVDDTIITAFGGVGGGMIFDPDDSGPTASGVNTKSHVIQGVALPLNVKNRSVNHATHAALDGSPIPWIPWFTPVEVTIDGLTFTPRHGLVDLGPNKRVSQPGKPKALDLTVMAAAYWVPDWDLKDIAKNFERRGSYRILGGARYAQA